jgi:uncharacterized protein (UPF0305 family)
MGIEEILDQIENIYKSISETDIEDEERIDKLEIEIQRLERKLAKEEAKLPVHPACVPFPSSSYIFTMTTH